MLQANGWLWLVVVLVAVVVGLVVGSAAGLQAAADRRRREALLVWSAERRWDWVGPDDSLVHLLPGEPFGRGHSRSARQTMTGTWDGRPVLAFDYTYRVTTGSGKNRRTSTYRYGVLAVLLPVALPRVQVEPEGALDRIAQAFGADDIEVESHAFNSRYTVRSSDRRAASAILHPRLVELLTTVEPVAWRTDVSSRGPVLLTWWAGRLDPVTLQQRLLLVDRVLDAVPAWLWREHGWDPAPESRPGPAAPEA